MSDSSPEERIVERTRRGPETADHVHVLVSIPLVYATGLVVWWLIGLQLPLAMAGSSVLAFGVLADALFLNPPTP